MEHKSPDGCALLVIDMQNDFVINENSPVFIKGGKECIPYVSHVVECARKANVPVIWVVREHEPSGLRSTHPAANLRF
jgi:nicotinamidase-related amidase